MSPREIRDTITGFWKTVEWDWYRQKPDSDFLYWHWSPDHGFYINHPLVGWNETMIIYLLAIASPARSDEAMCARCGLLVAAPCTLWFGALAADPDGMFGAYVSAFAAGGVALGCLWWWVEAAFAQRAL